MIRSLITSAHQAGRKVGICGQAPSDYPDFAEFLVECGIDSISLNPDSVVKVKRRVAEAEVRRDRKGPTGGPGASTAADWSNICHFSKSKALARFTHQGFSLQPLNRRHPV